MCSSDLLEQSGYLVDAAPDGRQALDLLQQNGSDLVITDLMMPGMSGLDLLKEMRSEYPDLAVIVVTAFGTVETAVEAMKAGAYDYISKPVNIDELKLVVGRALEHVNLKEEVRALRSSLDRKYGFENILGRSKALLRVLDMASRAAQTNSTVLIRGETGTGKELLAKAIHFNSLRKAKPFVTINCGAIPKDLLESELFGHVKGSFTGAMAHKKGKVELADGGTLFLDEVGDMSLKTQSKVLRTLDEQRFTPVGGDDTITVNVRVIAATNKDLEEEISKGNFREDLFYRLNVIPFYVPPLRERKEDIPLLARYFLKEFSATYGRRPREITDDAIEALMRYSWPGNVRELRNVMERIVIMNPTAFKLDRKHLPPLVYRDGSRRPLGEASTLHQARAAYERDYILKKLDENHGNVSRTAEVLGLERSHLYRKMKSLGIAVKE